MRYGHMRLSLIVLLRSSVVSMSESRRLQRIKPDGNVLRHSSASTSENETRFCLLLTHPEIEHFLHSPRLLTRCAQVRAIARLTETKTRFRSPRLADTEAIIADLALLLDLFSSAPVACIGLSLELRWIHLLYSLLSSGCSAGSTPVRMPST